MPPKEPKKEKIQVKKRTIKKFVPTIDAKRHEQPLKYIKQAHLKELLTEEAEEESTGEEEEHSEEELEDTLSEFDVNPNEGRIDLSFPETTEEFADSPKCYPPTYYTLTAKERLLLLYAENFRRQFLIKYPKRRPLVLAVPNECRVQKFVCTTIRPMAFCHEPLIGNVDGIASYVSDCIIYEPLKCVTSLPTRLISPASLLRVCRGNSFEMASLLVSMLIGAGFPALVVSGVAREATVMNDQRNVEYPFEIIDPTSGEEVKEKPTTGKKYKLRPMPDLESHLEENMAAMMKQKEVEELQARKEAERLEREELDQKATDKFHYHRCHAWVVIIENAPWSIGPKKNYINEDGETVEEPPKARFIEPSTGFQCDTKAKQYILVDSIWNQYNYYVNLQKYKKVSEIRWDLRDVKDWEHLLPGEPPQMRQYKMISDENIDGGKRDVNEEKHLDTIRYWVIKPTISIRCFNQRFPKLKKTVYYKKAIYIRYSPYYERDAKIMQLTLYADDEYKEPVTRWEHFGLKCRSDILQYTKFTYATGQKQESFKKGRNDNLKYMEYNLDTNKPKYLYFYSAERLDSMKYMEIHTDKILLKYSKRSDLCFYQEFEMKPSSQTLKKITEKFSRNLTDDIPAYKDIAVRTFILNQRKIIIKYHYARGALTSTTIEFTKPPKPDYGQEIRYEPNLTKIYKANASDPDPTPLELYKILLFHLQYEEKVKKQFERIMEEINCILDLRKQEMMYPTLTFTIFDFNRNGAAKRLRLQQDADEEAFKIEMSKKPADYLSPYLVPYNRQLTYEESWAAYNACLFDLKTRFVGILNDLQRQYEDLTTEAKSLKRFLKKFENQFSNFDFERLVKEAKDIELNKRMVQQALEQTHEDSQKKYEFVKESLMNDARLNLKHQENKNK